MDTSPIFIELIAPNCDKKEVLISGTFNGWNTTSEVVKLQQKAPGYYRGEANWRGKQVNYKYHLGGWHEGELDEWGVSCTNRSYDGSGTIRDHVHTFLKDGAYHKEAFLPRIEMLPSNMPLPKSFATRRIAALLPAGYDQNNAKRYPVLYLQDGQNLFDEFAPYGNWSLDKRLAWLNEHGKGDFIVIAIDHAEEKRTKEYAPPHETRVGVGEADAYGDFIVNHLKPLIDRTYRTKADRDHTAIGGSSMGAVASLHVAMLKGDYFGRVMLFSPSIWIDPDLTDLWPIHPYGDTYVYLYGGMEETEGTGRTFALLAKEIPKVSSPKRRIFLQSKFAARAKHNENAWSRAFPAAAAYLFAHD
ncbi:MAG: alpha/beta hydrolase [Saprospiraceae bacterium]